MQTLNTSALLLYYKTKKIFSQYKGDNIMSANIVKNKGYVAMPIEHLVDSRLSLSAKGLYSEMIDNEKSEFSMTELTAFGDEGEIYSSIAELINYGYVTRKVGA
jgi:hypothetical protein